MSISARARRLAALVVASAFLALPAAAQATLAFVRNPMHPAVYAAADDGSSVHRIAAGANPHVSPDGRSIVFFAEGPDNSHEMKVAPAGGGPARTLLVGWQEINAFAFSPDSTTVAALRGPEVGKRKLVVVDVASGSQRVLAGGYFGGLSFSPDGTELAYSRAGSPSFPPPSDVFRVPATGGKPVRLTKDHNSQGPLWGPNGQIVFVKMLGAKKRKYGPKTELFLMNEAGKRVKRLTHTKVAPLLIGLFPTDWSADGKRLLAEFNGQDTSYAVTVNPRTGAQRPVAGTGEAAFIGSALSSDGSSVLGFTGGFEPSAKSSNVATVPYGGGKPRVLVKGAFLPSWSR